MLKPLIFSNFASAFVTLYLLNARVFGSRATPHVSSGFGVFLLADDVPHSCHFRTEADFDLHRSLASSSRAETEREAEGTEGTSDRRASEGRRAQVPATFLAAAGDSKTKLLYFTGARWLY